MSDTDMAQWAQEPPGVSRMGDCANCGGFDIEWMYRCDKHAGIEYCRGCSCPLCDEDKFLDDDCWYDGDEWDKESQESAK